MKKLLYPIAFTLTTFLILYSCSAEEEDTTPPPSIIQTPEPEPAPTQYTLTVTSGEGGTVSTEGGTYDEGAEVTITATPEEGYEFVGWSDGETSFSRNINISADIILVAEFNISMPSYERYSSINETTSSFLRQKYFYRYLRQDEIIAWHSLNLDGTVSFCNFFAEGGQNNSCYGNFPYYGVHGSYYITADFNNDSKLDLFNTSWKFTGEGLFGNEKTQHLFVSDYFNQGLSDYKVLESPFINWAAPMSFADFDNDGYLDVWIGQNNRHNNALIFNQIQQEETNNAGQQIPPGTGSIVYFGENGPIEEIATGPVIENHQTTSGDLDGDGDIDIVVFAHGVAGEITPSPKIILNQGGRVFETIELLEDSETFMSKNNNQWCALSWNLFDIDGDGNLDIFGGHEINEEPLVDNGFYEDSELGFHNNNKMWIIWGTDKLQFNSENIQIIEKNSTYEFVNYNHLGSAFTDFDNDGDIDIVSLLTAVTENIFYKNYQVLLHENKGNRIFEDVSDIKIVGNSSSDRGKFGEFYFAVFIDKDNDGDFDLVPYSNADSFFSQSDGNYLTNLYWENTGGQFVRREND